MNLFEYLNEHPAFGLFQITVAGYFGVYLVAVIIGTITTFLFRSWNRFLRHLNIRKCGWPPAHCDADGDLKQTPNTDTP